MPYTALLSVFEYLFLVNEVGSLRIKGIIMMFSPKEFCLFDLLGFERDDRRTE
jgi:hypothetical protein